MRGIAAVAAAAAVWVIVTGAVPRFEMPRLPRVHPLLAFVSVLVGLAVSVATLGVVGVPSVAIAIGVLAAAVPGAVHRERVRRQAEAVADAWPDVLARMRSRLSGGSTLVEAFVTSIATAPQQLSALAPVVDETVRYGGGFSAALDHVRCTLSDPIADRVTMTLGIASAAGGRKVGEVLAALSASVADELRLRRAHHAAMTEQRLTAAVALVAPWALLALTIGTNPQSASAYAGQTGTVIVAIGLVATGAGYLFALRSARLSEPPRVFE